MKKPILVTGGIGYIGSHTVAALSSTNQPVVIFDNLANSSLDALDRLSSLLGKSIDFIQGDVRNLGDLLKVFSLYDFDSVIHFAGLKSVSESCQHPLHYIDNNVVGTVNLLQAMNINNVHKLVFSSSATVYGIPDTVPIAENQPLSTTNPYGQSKLMCEDILRSIYASDNSWSIAILRYFNPVGAHESGLIGELPNGIPNNLMPYITQVAKGRQDHLRIFGNNYSTPDGTGVRDYIHVMDLAEGHLAALNALSAPKLLTVNLGTGKGTSVSEMVATFNQVNGLDIPFEIYPRRDGDVAECYADPSHAKEILKWSAKRELADMCRDAWRWECSLSEN